MYLPRECTNQTAVLINCMGRSQSSKSLQGMPEPDTSEPSARSFLLGTAKRSLDEAFGFSVLSWTRFFSVTKTDSHALLTHSHPLSLILIHFHAGSLTVAHSDSHSFSHSFPHTRTHSRTLTLTQTLPLSL